MTVVGFLLQMIVIFCPAAALASAGLAIGSRSSEFADTETSTNVALTALAHNDRLFTLSLELEAAADNAVEVAFGKDRDGDGELAVEETELSIGWDTGAWFVEDHRADVSDRAERPDGKRRLGWAVRLNDCGEARSAEARDGGQAVLAAATVGCRPSCYSAEWNLARVTTRGVDAPVGHVGMRLVPAGLEVRIR